MAKLWDKKGISIDKEIEKFAVGNEHIIDLKLVKYDCIASIAHVKMLKKIGVLNAKELDQLIAGLQEIIKLDSEGKFSIAIEQEDCHTAIENFLVAKLGDAGKKIHTCRSRNDQIIAALRLYQKDELQQSKMLVQELIISIKKFSEKNKAIPMPGYTHMRKAMPYSVGKWAEAFSESLQDDLILIDSAFRLIDQNPLGSAAGYGVPVFNIDRKLTADLLGFEKVQNNILYVQNSKGKFELAILDALNQIMLDLNKLASDIWIFTTVEFGYFDLPKEFSMGSSIMPQKSNPDVIELVRAKAGVMKGYRDSVNNIILGLPSGYNGDGKLIKEPLMNGIELSKSCIKIMALAMEGLKVNEEKCRTAMTPELYATEKALQLVKKGVPFREAYRQVGERLNK